jgi:hypothetical protein
MVVPDKKEGRLLFKESSAVRNNSWAIITLGSDRNHNKTLKRIMDLMRLIIQAQS